MLMNDPTKHRTAPYHVQLLAASCDACVCVRVCVCCGAGFLVDYCGRKETIIINDFIFLLGTVLLSAAHSYVALVRPRSDDVLSVYISCRSAVAA